MDTLSVTSIEIPVHNGVIQAGLALPALPEALVVVVHGSGSNRFSARNQAVASTLLTFGQATLLLDLLTDNVQVDQDTRERWLDIEGLSSQVVRALQWIRKQPELDDLPIGLFGASTGAAVALRAAAAQPADVGAVVCRGGRPDLAGDALETARAPTLLIVGGADTSIIDVNRRAAQTMHAPCELVLVEGATHLFEEPGAIDEVAGLATAWFAAQLLPEPDLLDGRI